MYKNNEELEVADIFDFDSEGAPERAKKRPVKKPKKESRATKPCLTVFKFDNLLQVLFLCNLHPFCPLVCPSSWFIGSGPCLGAKVWARGNSRCSPVQGAGPRRRIKRLCWEPGETLRG